MNWSDATPARVQRIAKMLRHQDRLEVLYSHGLSGEDAVMQSWRNSQICRCIDGDDGKAVGICGVGGDGGITASREALLPSSRAKSRRCIAAATAVHTPPADYQELIDQLKHNLLDEIVVVELYEKFFACKVKIIHGWVNSYAIQSGKKSVHLDFIKLKTRIIEHLEQL